MSPPPEMPHNVVDAIRSALLHAYLQPYTSIFDTLDLLPGLDKTSPTSTKIPLFYYHLFYHHHCHLTNWLIIFYYTNWLMSIAFL